MITGASGFIGSCIVEKAISLGYSTWAVIRKNSSKQYLTNTNLNFLEIDFSNKENIEDALINFLNNQGAINYIIHAAGVTKSINNQDFFDVNYGNTKNFVDALINLKISLTKFVFISSLASFGCSSNNLPINESQKPKPITAYGKSKLLAEEFLYSLGNFPFVIVNPTAVYGPRDKDFFFLIKSLNSGVEMYINNTKQKLSFVYVQDLVEAIFIVLNSKEINKNFIVSDGENYTSLQFNKLVKQNLNKKTFKVIVPAFIAYVFALFSELAGKITKKTPLLNRERLKEFKAKNWSVDASRIFQIGYKPTYTLHNGLKEAINWYVTNGWFNKK